MADDTRGGGSHSPEGGQQGTLQTHATQPHTSPHLVQCQRRVSNPFTGGCQRATRSCQERNTAAAQPSASPRGAAQAGDLQLQPLLLLCCPSPFTSKHWAMEGDFLSRERAKNCVKQVEHAKTLCLSDKNRVMAQGMKTKHRGI